MSFHNDIYVKYSIPVDGTDRAVLPEPRSYQKRRKEVFAWAKSRQLAPLPFFFSDDIDYLQNERGYDEGDIKELAFEEKWFSPEEMIPSVQGLLETARKASKKQATVKYFVHFLEALTLALDGAEREGARVHLSEAKGHLTSVSHKR